MEKLVKLALRIITVLILLATVVSFSESYHGLFEWAITHNVPWFWALIWPLMLDTVILVGECSVFVAIHKHWKLRHRFWAWAVTYSGLAVSTLANGGHVASKDWLTHVTNALPPIALMFALTVGLGVLKRTRMMAPDETKPVIRPATEISAADLAELRERAERELRPQPVRTPLTTPVSQTEMVPVSRPETPAERPAPVIPDPDESPESTRVQPGFKVTPKSYSQPPDNRQGLELVEKRVRDMYDVDPDISVNAIATSLGVAWATAKKYLEATKEARLQTA